MEPWDGPASIAFTDGTVVGAVLDRNGLRPSRYYVTKDDMVVMASEVGVLATRSRRRMWPTKSRLQPGRMFLVDTAQGRIIGDEEIKKTMAAAHPYQEWLDKNLVELDDLPTPPDLYQADDHASVLQRQHAFGYTFETLAHRCWRPWPRTASKRWAAWATIRRLRCCPTGRSCSTPTSANSLPRSPTRRWMRSARSWSPPPT